MKPTRSEIAQHNEFLARQRTYENKYYRLLLAYLSAVNRHAAESYRESQIWDGELYENRLESIYMSLYRSVTLEEAKTQWGLLEKDIQKKDLIDDLLGLFGTDSQPISMWRALLGEFIEARIAGRITQVNDTTRKRIANLIEKGINEGLGALDVARMIENDKEFNRNRALAIARTETVTAGNQGKYMSALTSPFVMLKKWIPTRDNRTRLSHLDMWDRPFVEMDQLFFVANANGALEQARYPCDSTLSASNTVNCRCVVTFKAKRDSNGRLIRKDTYIKSKTATKLFTTKIEAIDPLDGKLKTWVGDRIEANSFAEAETWAKENKGYLKVVGEFVTEINL